jgi:hypothetical protein
MRFLPPSVAALMLCFGIVNCSNDARIVDEKSQVGGGGSGGADVGTNSGNGGDTTSGTNGGNGGAGGDSRPTSGTSTATDETRVWFDSSAAIEIRKVWSYYFPGSPPYSNSGSTCSAISRSAMTQEQLRYLNSLQLIPIDERCKTLTRSCCTSDGYSYVELAVIGIDGNQAVYRDTGCVTFAVAGATYLLPANSFNATDFSAEGTETCGE